MTMYPEYRSIGWLCITVLAAFLFYSSAALFVSKYSWFNATDERQAFLGTFVALGVASALSIWFALDSPWNAQSQATYASLRLQFFGDDRTPTSVRHENVGVWYAYFNPSARASYKSTTDGKETMIAILPKTWVIFVVFERPTKYREITVGFSSPGLPVYDIRQPTEKSVIVSFRDDIPAGELEISTK